jgi:hypothetical protein
MTLNELCLTIMTAAMLAIAYNSHRSRAAVEQIAKNISEP